MLVDRLEELLALLEDEDDEDEREDALELALRAETAVSAAPAAEIETEEAPEDDAESVVPVPDEDEAVPVEAEGLNWGPDVKIASPEGQEEVPGADGAADGGMVENDAAGNEAAEFLWDELAAPVMGRNGTVALRKPGAGDVELPALAVTGPSGQAGTAAEMDSVMESMTSAEKGLEGLYKQTVQASRPAAQNLPVEQAGRSLRADEPGRTAALTVDELDRAVRRDSRRYDGGMTLF